MTTIRFQGFRDYLNPPVLKPKGIGSRLVPVHTVADRHWNPVHINSSVIKLQFPDSSSAYFRPSEEQSTMTFFGIPNKFLHLHDGGAYLLCKQLGLSIVAPTVLIELEPRKAKLKNISRQDRLEEVEIGGLGSLQEGIEGSPLSDLEEAAYSTDFNRWVELFIYTVVAYDADKVSRNVMQAKQTKTLYSIDNPLSGSDMAEQELLFPIEWESKFGHNCRIPEKYLQCLKGFLANRKQNTQVLLPYYTPQTIKGMFDRAKWLLEHPVIEDPRTLHRKMTNTLTYNRLCKAIHTTYRKIVGKPPLKRIING